MKFQKLVLATSVCAALSGASGVANADILGVPGEALLVTPMVVESSPPGVSDVETYVALRVPLNIGSDTVINNYTAPNTTIEGTVTTQTLDDPRIYWAVFDENSEKIVDGTCEVSPADVVIWTTDPVLQGFEAAQRLGLIASGIVGRPNPVCGPSDMPNRFGYVIFQTVPGADGQVADFAFTADAVISTPGLAGDVGVPVVPMADGADPLPSASGFPVYTNEVIAGGAYNNGTPSSPVRYAPIVAGIRMGVFDDLTDRVTQMPIPGANAVLGNAMAAHVYWFNLQANRSTDPNRTAVIDLYDDMEGQCSFRLPMPREVNIYTYNLWTTRAGASPLGASWGNLTAPPAGSTVIPNWLPDNRITDLITWVNGAGGYTSGFYCTPDYYEAVLAYPGALAGYAESWIQGYGYANPAQPADGNEHTASLQFALIQNGAPGGLWTGHLATDIGMQ